MKRINMIIGKKQIIIVGLTLILGVAIYVNYLVGGVPVDEPSVAGTQEDANSVGNYGDQIFVSSNDDSTEKIEPVSNEETDEYFAQARLDKQESRAEAIEVLQSIYGGGDSTETELAVIAQDAQQLSSYIESESRIENTLKAQGFDDVLCYLSDNKANIIVKTAGLDNAQAAQIKNALLSEVEIPAGNITIIEIK